MNLNKYSKLLSFFIILLGWIFIVPFTWLIPRNKNQIILFGNKNGSFLDNIKYFYLYLKEIKKDKKFFLVTSDKETYNLLKNKYKNILYYPSFIAYRKLLTCGTFVADNNTWMNNCRFQFLRGANIIQIWHGIGFKKIQRCNKKFIAETSSLYLRFYLNIVGKLPFYNALISTGTFFTERVFKPAFISDYFINTGYPRNDILVNPNKYEKAYINTDQKTINEVKEFKKKGTKCIVYAPTFRDTGGDAILDGIINLKDLNLFALENNFVFVFKFHPLPEYTSITEKFDRILWYENVKDIYPFLHMADAMISDYSSIYLDYLLLNRPIFLFLYDREKYETEDRELHPFYNDFILGDISKNQCELQTQISNTLNGNDNYSEIRKTIINKSHNFVDDNSSQRIYHFIKEKYL